jgi:hypothetical protein
VPGRGFSPDMQSLLFLAWCLPALAGIALGLYAPRTAARLRLALNRSRAVLSPA